MTSFSAKIVRQYLKWDIFHEKLNRDNSGACLKVARCSEYEYQQDFIILTFRTVASSGTVSSINSSDIEGFAQSKLKGFSSNSTILNMFEKNIRYDVNLFLFIDNSYQRRTPINCVIFSVIDCINSFIRELYWFFI